MKTSKLFGLFGAIVLIAVMAATSTAFAQRGGGGQRGEKMKERGAKIAEHLDLTSAQKDQIKALRQAFRETHASELQALKDLRQQMKEARQAKDREQAEQIREQMKTKMQALKADREQLHSRIQAVLTPEQQQKLAELKAKRTEHRGKRGRHQGHDGSAVPPAQH
jgi:Spy/CpxP family protein refolding chaperone